MAGTNEEADQLMAAGDKKANSKPGLFGFMSRSDQKYEDAYDLYQQAANTYKMSKNWSKAAEAYMKSSQMQEMLGVGHEAATCYIDASKMYKKGDVRSAIDPLQKAATAYAKLSRFNFASKYTSEVGEIMENDMADLEGALEQYEKAVDYAQMDGSAESTMAKANIKVAKLAAQLEKYERAIELFEEIANSYAENDLLKFSCKEFFLKAGLCILCQKDVETAKIKLDRYESNAAYFRDSREANLLRSLISAMENDDADEYTQVVKEYDAVSKLDAWMTQILLRIKKQIGGEDLL